MVTDRELPGCIAAGLSDVTKRGEWNKLASPEYALPMETWREVVARRSLCEAIRKKLAAGEVHSINDLVTCNLDLRRFAEDVLLNEEHGSELVWSFYGAIRSISVLDPACGSGAFLFAALNILDPLYDACLARMEAFLDDLNRSGEKHRPEKMQHFRNVLDQVHNTNLHPSPRYFILKSIILDNLYGVDIMEEATEICKLRLFLKLVAQVDASDKIEPLPDIDFNIRPGNSLVGFTTEGELKHAIGQKLDFDNRLQEVRDRAEQIELAFNRFRQMQVEYGRDEQDFEGAKGDLRTRLRALRGELDAHLAGEYGVKSADRGGLQRWRLKHAPFHWFVEFYGIMRDGGFDAVLGNPPYVEYSKVRSEYEVT